MNLFKFQYLLLLFPIICFTSCKDNDTDSSTTKAKSDSKEIFKSNSWVMINSSNSSSAQFLLSINPNGDYSRKYYDTDTTETGTWIVSNNGSYDELALIKNVSQQKSTYKITSISDDELIITINNISFDLLSVPQNTIYAIGGSVDNPNNVQLKNRAISAYWNCFTGAEDYGYIWGKGEFKANYSKFAISFATLPIDSCCNIFDTEGYKLGVAYIIIGSSNVYGNTLYDGSDIPNFYGAINNKAIVYVSKQVQNDISWLAEFPKGFSAGIGVKSESDGEHDSFKLINPIGIVMKVDSVADNFTFPNWY